MPCRDTQDQHQSAVELERLSADIYQQTYERNHPTPLLHVVQRWLFPDNLCDDQYLVDISPILPIQVRPNGAPQVAQWLEVLLRREVQFLCQKGFVRTQIPDWRSSNPLVCLQATHARRSCNAVSLLHIHHAS